MPDIKEPISAAKPVTDAHQYPNCGARTTEYPLWRAKEAFAQAEKRLASQQAQLNLLQARATSIFGWISAEILGTLGLLGANLSKGLASPGACYWVIFGISIIVPSLVAATHLCFAFPQTKWGFEGVSPAWLLASSDEQSEMTMLQAMAEMKADLVEENNVIIDTVAQNLRLGWQFFLITPIITLASVLLIFILSSI